MKKPSHIHLFGDLEENFYQLGLRDKSSFKKLYQQITSLCATNNSLKRLFKLTVEASMSFKKLNDQEYRSHIKAYAQGLGIKDQEAYFIFLIPEFVSAFNKWTPELLSLVPGCSSFFQYDSQNDSTIHTRVLDYSISGGFEENERSVLYDFKERYKIFSYNSAGMPYPVVTSINEKGLTVAIHYKHSSHFDKSGHSIFSLVFKILSYCQSIQEAKKFLKAHPSMSYWGLCMSDTQNQVASFDIDGAKLHQVVYNMRDHKTLYFNNLPIKRDKDLESLQPFGHRFQCQARFKRFKEIQSKIEKNISMQRTIEVITQSHEVKRESLPILTPSSLQLCSFNNKLQSSIFVAGHAPKLDLNNVVEHKDIFQPNYNRNFIKLKNHLKDNKRKFYHHLTKTQSLYDQGNQVLAYHHIQMALDYIDHKSFQFYHTKFFFLVFQYLNTSKKEDIRYLYKEFSTLEGKLNEYLEDHRRLFSMRCAKNLSIPLDKALKPKHKQLKEIFNKERKLKNLVLEGLKKLTVVRIEISDILYLY